MTVRQRTYTSDVHHYIEKLYSVSINGGRIFMQNMQATYLNVSERIFEVAYLPLIFFTLQTKNVLVTYMQ